MHLFGRTSGPHLAHFRAKCQGDQVELTWKVRNAGDVRWRVEACDGKLIEHMPVPGASQPLRR